MGSPVERAIAWLESDQCESGSFRSYSSALIGAPEWVEDDVNFVTALSSMALRDVEDPRVAAMRVRMADHLRTQRERGDLWRYWSTSSDLHDYTPLDVDDTACCSMALGIHGARGNARMLLGNRDLSGRFYTWLLPRDGQPRRLRRRLRDEASPTVLSRREALWSNSEASPDDVDVVVNANVIRYLGPGLAPEEPIRWVLEVVRSGSEVEADHWYRSRTSLYRSVTAALRSGVTAFAQLREPMIERLVDDPGPSALRSDLELADALGVLQDLKAPPDAVGLIRQMLLDRQLGDGRWSRSLCYYGGPQESFGWASEALATAAAVGALHRADFPEWSASSR